VLLCTARGPPRGFAKRSREGPPPTDTLTVSSSTPARNQNTAIPSTLNYNDADQLLPAHPERRRTAGARLHEVFPIVPIAGNVPLGIGALSYAGQFTISVAADRDGCPTPRPSPQGPAALDQLSQPVPAPS
jgi:hypothetical protein